LRGGAARTVLETIRDGECHCTHECYFITNILFNPRLYPALLREYLGLARSARARPGGVARPAKQPAADPQPEQTLDTL
ncbi:MAG: hypothetical protein OEY27_08130, partial [Gammaproteobacteria bacterium]|nr:hypothetical protein [Gammaproteobacteria bacterium]